MSLATTAPCSPGSTETVSTTLLAPRLVIYDVPCFCPSVQHANQTRRWLIVLILSVFKLPCSHKKKRRKRQVLQQCNRHKVRLHPGGCKEVQCTTTLFVNEESSGKPIAPSQRHGKPSLRRNHPQELKKQMRYHENKADAAPHD